MGQNGRVMDIASDTAYVIFYGAKVEGRGGLNSLLALSTYAC